MHYHIHVEDGTCIGDYDTLDFACCIVALWGEDEA